MASLALFVLLQVVSTNTTTTASVLPVKPLWFIVVEVVAVLVAMGIAGTLLSRVVRTVALRAGASKGVANSARQWITVLVIISAVAATAYLTGISSEITTLTLSGIAGLAISLALQNTISNVISGVLLLNDGIIRLGDDIQYGGPGGVRGEIVKLSLRTTWIRTPAGVISVIGNSNLSAGPILNYSAKTRLEKKLEV